MVFSNMANRYGITISANHTKFKFLFYALVYYYSRPEDGLTHS